MAAHGKNFRHIDFNPSYAENAGRKRLYLMWDLDAAITDIGSRHLRQQERAPVHANAVSERHPQPGFRAQYNTIMSTLLDPATGPLSETALHVFLTNVEPHVAFALAEDPYAGFTPAPRP